MARTRRNCWRALSLLLLGLVAGVALAQQGRLDTTTIRIGSQTLDVELALTARQQQIGLMYRRRLEPDSGMLFVFETTRPLNFWMKNTLIPLDIAYLDAQGLIVDIQQMQPRSLEPHPSKAPARFALEVEQGWFARHGIGVGDRVELPTELLTR